eukprot:Seg2217.6 transcript_id=Seg2217.6/GoldUCD/mRNA.D3Y31 product="hypothetical protein" protein_id=Seg2217.6/GoldUCD/D3Y31
MRRSFGNIVCRTTRPSQWFCRNPCSDRSRTTLRCILSTGIDRQVTFGRNLSGGTTNHDGPKSKAELATVACKCELNTPLVYATSKVTDIGELLEKPFIFRSEKRRKRSKKKSKAVRAKEKSNAQPEDLKASENDCATIKSAVEIFNSIPKEERESGKRNLIKAKEKKSIELVGLLQNNQAHILGLSDTELKSRYEFLCEHGIRKAEALNIALQFPMALSFQNSNVENLVKLFASYKLPLLKIFTHHPYLFSLSHSEVLKKLDHLGSIGLRKKDVSDLINANPIILCFGLNETAKHALKICTNISGSKGPAWKSHFIQSLVRTSLAGDMATKYEFDNNFGSVTFFLEGLSVPDGDIFERCPVFFSLDKDKLLRTTHILGDAPFFFDTEDIGKFIQKHPEIFLQLDDEDTKARIIRIYEKLGEDAELHDIMQATPKMLTSSSCVESRIALLAQWKFTNKHIGYLMKTFPILFYHNRVVENIEDRLEFLLGNEDLYAEDIMKFPFCLQMRLVILRCKIGFIRIHNPQALKTSSLQEIFTAKDEEFVLNICSSNLQTYTNHMMENFSEADQIWMKSKGRPQVRRALSETFS